MTRTHSLERILHFHESRPRSGMDFKHAMKGSRKIDIPPGTTANSPRLLATGVFTFPLPFLLILLCLTIAAETPASEGGMRNEFVPANFDNVVRDIRNLADRIHQEAISCASKPDCPVVDCNRAAEVRSELMVLSNYMSDASPSMRKLGRAIFQSQKSRIEKSLQTGQANYRVKIALLWQRPLVEFGEAMFNIASVLGDIETMLSKGMSSGFTVDALYELLGDLKSSYQGFSRMLETDIEKAYPEDKKAVRLHGGMKEALQEELGITENNVHFREEQISTDIRLLEILKTAHAYTFGNDGIGIWKSDLSNVAGIADSIVSLQGALKKLEARKSAYSAEKYQMLVKKEREKAISGIRTAVLSVIARHLKDYAMDDMKKRIQRMRKLTSIALQEDRNLAVIHAQKARFLKSRELFEQARKALERAQASLTACQNYRLCAAISASPVHIESPALGRDSSFERLKKALQHLQRHRTVLSEIMKQAFSRTVRLADGSVGRCKIGEATLERYEVARCPGVKPVPPAPTVQNRNVGPWASCGQCRKTAREIDDLDVKLKSITKELSDLSGRLNPIIAERKRLDSQTRQLQLKIDATGNGAMAESVDLLTGARVSVMIENGYRTITRTFPDGRVEKSKELMKDAQSLIRNRQKLEHRLKAINKRIDRMHRKAFMLDKKKADLERQRDNLDRSLGDCQRQCRQSLQVLDRGNGVFVLSADGKTAIDSDHVPPWISYRRFPDPPALACPECEQHAGRLKEKTLEARRIARELRADMAQFSALMDEAKRILEHPNRRIVRKIPLDVFQTDYSGRNRIYLCEMLGPRKTAEVLEIMKNYTRAPHQRTVDFAIFRKESPAILRSARIYQKAAIDMLPDIQDKLATLRALSQDVDNLRSKLEQCALDHCFTSGENDTQLPPSPPTFQSTCERCGKSITTYKKAWRKLSNRLEELARLKDEETKLRRRITEAIEHGDLEMQKEAERQLDNLVVVEKPDVTTRYWQTKMEAGKLLQEIESCEKTRCTASPIERKPPFSNDEIHVEVIQVTHHTGNNPLFAEDPVDPTGGTGGTGSSPAGANTTGQAVADLCKGQSIVYSGLRASVSLQIDQAANTCRLVDAIWTDPALFTIGGGTTVKDGQVSIGYQAGAFISEVPGGFYPDNSISYVTVETAGHDVNGVPLPRIRFDLVINDTGPSVEVSISNATAF